MKQPKSIYQIILSVLLAGFIFASCNSNKSEKKEGGTDTSGTKMEQKMDTGMNKMDTGMNKMDTGHTKPVTPGN